MANISSLIQRFPYLRVLIIGDPMLDSYVESIATLRHERSAPIVRKIAERHFPGGAANTAANLRSLGAHTTFLSMIGQDMAGTLLRSELAKYNIDGQWLLQHADIKTQHKQRILVEDQYIIRIDDGAFPSLKERTSMEEVQNALIHGLEAVYPFCDLVVVSDYCYGVVSQALIEHLRLLYQKQPHILLVDSKSLANFRTLPITVVTPNYSEACKIVGKDSGETTFYDLAEVERIGRHLLSLLATEHVAITLSQQGVFLLSRQGQAHHLPAYPVVQVNDVGAGDSFASAMALALAAGGTVLQAADIGLVAASIAVNKHWTATVYYKEVWQYIEQRKSIANTPEVDTF